MKRFSLEITIFMAGAAVMALELAGSRVLAPYVGTSIVVWTSLIGIILASLSIGYWLGGRLADKGATEKNLARILLLAGAFVLLLALIDAPLLRALAASFKDVRIAAILGTLALFAFPSMFLGAVTPYATRLKLTSVLTAGEVIGTMSALSAMGSIAGTFFAGYFLIAYIGTSYVLLGIAGTLFLLALFVGTASERRIAGIALILVYSLTITTHSSKAISAAHGFVDRDTAYNRVWIYESNDPVTSLPIRALLLGNVTNSGMFLESDELVFEYTKLYRLVEHFKPDVRRALMIGGGAYSYPRDFLARIPEARIDVVEIDPGITAMAKEFFRLTEDARLTIYHEDARPFLTHKEGAYDVIFGDAFQSYYSIPFQLTTHEAALAMQRSLAPDGILLMNMVSAIEGPRGKFLRAEVATLRKAFPYVYVFAANARNGETVQNLMVLAIKGNAPPSFESSSPELASYIARLWKKEIPEDMPILTDDYAPVEHYILEAMGGAI